MRERGKRKKMKLKMTNHLQILSSLGVITEGRKFLTKLGVGVKMRLALILQSTSVQLTQNLLSFGRKNQLFLKMNK